MGAIGNGEFRLRATFFRCAAKEGKAAQGACEPLDPKEKFLGLRLTAQCFGASELLKPRTQSRPQKMSTAVGTKKVKTAARQSG